MDIFLDTACLSQIQPLLETGLVDGITTNPSLLAKAGKNPLEILKNICAVVSGPVSAEVTRPTCPEMLKEAQVLLAISSSIVIKVPVTQEGLKACFALSAQGVSVNVTLCFSVNQALLAAKAGAAYISPFVGRIDDQGQDGIQLLHDIRHVYDLFDVPTKILAASLRNPQRVADAALSGCHCATIPPAVFAQMYDHPLTEKGLLIFEKDWGQTCGF